MSLRIVFMGTPAFAVATLRRLVEDKWDVCAVYTGPDKPKNRGMKLLPTPVKEFAVTAGIQVYQPASCRDEAVLDQLRDLAPDVIVVAAYGKLLPEALLNIPRLATINVHSSILPQYRGAAPINWAVLNGDEETGVTIQYMAPQLDAGDILLVKTTPWAGRRPARPLLGWRPARPEGRPRSTGLSTSTPPCSPGRCPPWTSPGPPGSWSIRCGG